MPAVVALKSEKALKGKEGAQFLPVNAFIPVADALCPCHSAEDRVIGYVREVNWIKYKYYAI